MTTTLIKCFRCKSPITDGDVYEVIMDGYPLEVHIECPVIIEPEAVDDFSPPFYKIVRALYKIVGREL